MLTDSMWLLAMFCGLPLVFLLILTLFLVWRLFLLIHQEKQTARETALATQEVMSQLLTNQMEENQRLRNLFLSSERVVTSPANLLGLQYATIKSEREGSEDADLDDLAMAVDYEDRLAREGFPNLGDLGNDLESAGWPNPIVRKDSSGDPIAYDS